MSNLSSLTYYIPELIIGITILSTIIFGLVDYLKKYLFILAYSSLIVIFFILLFSFNNYEQLFNGLIVIDSYSYLFKLIFVLSTFSILIVTQYSLEITSNRSEYIAWQPVERLKSRP